MKVDLFRLGSVGGNTVGGPEAGAISLIYTFLLQEFNQDAYSYIHINHIGEELNELNEQIMKEARNKIFINIRYPITGRFEQKSVDEKNRISLDIVHTALMRIADYDKKLDTAELEIIKNKILENNFSFEFELKTYPNKKNKTLLAIATVCPLIDKFDYSVLIKEKGNIKCRLKIYSAGTNTFYFSYFFGIGKWKNDEELILTGTKKEVETHIIINECRIEVVNLSPYQNPPYYTMIKSDVSEQDKENASEDYWHSLPPAIAAIIRQANN